MAYTPEEAKELIRELTSQKSKLVSEEASIYQRVEKIDKVLRLTWFLIFGFAFVIVAVTTFYINVVTKLSEHDLIFREREVRLLALETTKQTDLVTAVAKLAVTEALRRDVDKNTARSEAFEPKIITLWDMMKRGQSNKESFFLEKGFEAPSIIPNARKE